MIYMLSKNNATAWFVHGRTTIQASHRNGSTAPHVTKYQIAKNQTFWQLEWISRSNHMTIQLLRCS